MLLLLYSICVLLSSSSSRHTLPLKIILYIITYAIINPTHTTTQSWCVNQKVYQCLSSGRGAKMTNKTSGTASAAVTEAWQEMPESLTPSEGWGASGLIRISCHLWQPPWQTWEWAWETERSGTSWQSDPGPVAAALAMQHRRVRSLGDRPGPLRLSGWISSPWERGQPQDPHVDKWGHKGLVHWVGLTLKPTVAETDPV